VSTVYDLTLEQLTDRVVAWGEPAFRAKQIWSQLWKRAATYEQMSDVSPALRERLATDLPLGVEILDERTADKGATRKGLLRLGGAHVIETVLMGYRDRVTVCVSSQVGCAMGCGFCATGQMGLEANLTAGEIAAQVVWARREAARLPDSTPRRLTNVVFMGKGEASAGIYYSSGSRTVGGRQATEFIANGHRAAAEIQLKAVNSPRRPQ
jgi:23S rRNA (adenine2503-C2)-methyltransferase